MSYTKGEWLKVTDKSGETWIQTEECEIICLISVNDLSPREQADAQLITSAPELLEELIIAQGLIKEIYDAMKITRPESSLKRIEAAITKATQSPNNNA